MNKNKNKLHILNDHNEHLNDQQNIKKKKKTEECVINVKKLLNDICTFIIYLAIF